MWVVRVRVCLLVLAVGAAACGRADRAPSVVLVTIDTLRADHLGTYGYAPPTSPFIDGLAATSAVFENASSTCPATAPSIASLLTGMHRAAHGVRRNGSVLRPDATTLAERLHAAGYKTLARGTNPVLDTKRGFAQGFDVFLLPDYAPDTVGAASVAHDVKTLLADVGEGPFFLWVHFLDPHGPYVAPAEYQARFRAADYGRPGEGDLPIGHSNYGLHVIPRYQAVAGRGTPADYRASYDAEIRYTDDNVKAIVDELRARGFWDRVVFVLTADHGESLGEHDYYFQHGLFAYDDCLRVPLVMHAPGLLSTGRRVPQSVSLIDVVPTILELVQLPAAAALEGSSLLPLVRGQEVGGRPSFAQTYYGSEQAAVRTRSMKYILTRAATPGDRVPDGVPRQVVAPAQERGELYDLAADPGELEDLSQRQPRVLSELRERLMGWLAEQNASPGAGDHPEAERDRTHDDPSLEDHLRSLGYVN